MDQFGDWKLVDGDAIGGGQFGKVYRVVRNAPGTNVPQFGALKLAGDAQNQHHRLAIENEISSYASLQSPFIPTFYETGWDPKLGNWFVVALIKGKNLKEYLDSGEQLGREAWYELADNIISALVTVHSASLTHLDIWKPNVMKIDSGQWMLIDFGLTVKEFAKPLLSNWGWGAPEQYLGDITPTAAADIFALGNLLYCALTNKNPFDVYEPLFYSDAVQQFAPNLTGVDSDIRDFLGPMFAIKPEKRPTAAQLKQSLRVLRGLESSPEISRQSITAWTQISRLVEVQLEVASDFRLTLRQAPGIEARIDIVLDETGYRVGFNSEKSLGKVITAAGLEHLARSGFAIDPSGNYYTRIPKSAHALPSVIEALAREGIGLSLAELFYEVS